MHPLYQPEDVSFAYADKSSTTVSMALDIANELTQVRTELQMAWEHFRFGGTLPAAGSIASEAPGPGVGDRIDLLIETLRHEVRELYALAENIRARS